MSKFSKISIIVKKFRFWSIFMEISILVKISENLDFGQNCRKNLDLGHHFWKISILVNIFGNLDLGLVKIEHNVDFSQIFKRLWFWSNFYKKTRFGSNFSKILISVEIIVKTSNLVEIFEKSRFWWKLSKIVDFGQKLPKCRFWSKLMKILSKSFRKMSTWVETYQVVDFGQNWRKCWF